MRTGRSTPTSTPTRTSWSTRSRSCSRTRTSLIGGSFTKLQPNGAASPTYATHLAILNPDGTLDTAFSAGTASSVTGQVLSFAQQPNGQVIVGGSFSAMQGSPAPYLERLNGDASIDASFNSGVDGPVNAVAILPTGASTQTPSNSGVWLNANGQVRYAYSAASNGEVVCSAQQANGPGDRRRPVQQLQRGVRPTEPGAPQHRRHRGRVFQPHAERGRQRDHHPAQRADRHRRRLHERGRRQQRLPRAPQLGRDPRRFLRAPAQPPGALPPAAARREHRRGRRLHADDPDRGHHSFGAQLHRQAHDDRHGRLDV